MSRTVPGCQRVWTPYVATQFDQGAAPAGCALTVVHQPEPKNGCRRRASKRGPVLASRCVGKVALRPLEGDVLGAVAEALGALKRQQTRSASSGTAVPVDGYGHSDHTTADGAEA